VGATVMSVEEKGKAAPEMAAAQGAGTSDPAIWGLKGNRDAAGVVLSRPASGPVP
jgi:hypothetical protein